MNVKLLDYSGKEVVVDVGNIEDIAVMSIIVMTGDEILTVIYKDHSKKIFDSSECRIGCFHDDVYDIYNVNDGTNMLNNEKFVNRTNTYWRVF